MGVRTGLAALYLASACGLDTHPLDELRQPGGLALSPGGSTLFVALGNWDRRYANSGLVGLDLDRLVAAVAGPRSSAPSPCAPGTATTPARCDASALLRPEVGLRLPSGPVNIGSANLDPERGTVRLLVPTRIEPSLTWIDVVEDASGVVTTRCARDRDGVCGSQHRVDAIAEDPGRITVDRSNQFAYLPHVLERVADECEDDTDPSCSGVTMFRLDGVRGPELADTARNFFRQDPLHESGLRGGFAIAQLPCDPERAPWISSDCARPVLFATHRYWFGYRMFSVAPGLDVMIGNTSIELGTANTAAAPNLPLMGDLEFEDEAGERLLVVHTTPPTLARVDTRLADDLRPFNSPMNSLALCTNPNLLELDRSRELAFVTCRATNELAIIDLRSFERIRTLELDEGPNEMLVDPARGWLYVANDIGGSISVIELDRARPGYLREIARVE